MSGWKSRSIAAVRDRFPQVFDAVATLLLKAGEFRIVDLDPVARHLLGAVHGGRRVAEHILCVIAVGWENREPCRYGTRESYVINLDRLAKC